MATRGGISTLKGIRYQLKVVLYYIPAVLRGEVETVRCEPRSAALSPQDEPSPVLLDDFSMLYPDGRKVFGQAKSTESHANWTVSRLQKEGVLEQLAEQHEMDSQAELQFVSNARSTSLEALSDRARECISSREFVGNLGKELREELEDVAQGTARPPEFWWSALRRVKVVLLTECHIEELIRNYAAGRYRDVDKFVAVLRREIEENPGTAFTRQLLLSALEKAGLFEQVVGLSESIAQTGHRLEPSPSSDTGDQEIRRQIPEVARAAGRRMADDRVSAAALSGRLEVHA